MIYKDFLMEFGAALKDAEITDSKFDNTGYGEITLWLKSFCKEALFSYTEDSPSVRLISFDDMEERIEDLNRDVCWDDLFEGELLDKLSQEQQDNSGGPYYDFYYKEYLTEEEFAERYC